MTNEYTNNELYFLIDEIILWPRFKNPFNLNNDLKQYNEKLIYFKRANDAAERSCEFDLNQKHKARRRELQLWLLEFKERNLEYFI